MRRTGEIAAQPEHRDAYAQTNGGYLVVIQ